MQLIEDGGYSGYFGGLVGWICEWDNCRWKEKCMK